MGERLLTRIRRPPAAKRAPFEPSDRGSLIAEPVSMRIAVLLFLTVGCGGRVSENVGGDASTEVEADVYPDTPSELGTDAMADVASPPGCVLADNACYRAFLAAVERARSCFPHFGSSCGTWLDADAEQCGWPDGARTVGALEAPYGWVARGHDGEVCAQSVWSHRSGELVFADGSRFALEFHEFGGGTRLQCPGRGSFYFNEYLGACSDTIRTCCRR